MTWRAYVPYALVTALAGLLASPARNDFFQFWWAGHLVATGRSPYDPAAWQAALAYGPAAGSVATNCAQADAPACLWTYPPWTAWLFAPFGALDLDTGIALERLALLGALAVGAALAVRAAGPTRDAAAAALLLAVALSAPFVREVLTGHFEGLLLVGLVLLAAGLRDRRSLPLAAGLVLLALKPHLSVVTVPLVLAGLVLARAYRAALAGAAGLAVLAVVGAVADPRATASILGSGAKVGLSVSTSWGLAARLGVPAAAIGLVAVAVAAAVLAWRGAAPADRPFALVAIGAELGLAVLPYAQSYDQVLMVPAIAILLARRGPLLVACGGLVWVAVTWGAYLLELQDDPRAYAGALPALVLVALALAARRRRAEAPSA